MTEPDVLTIDELALLTGLEIEVLTGDELALTKSVGFFDHSFIIIPLSLIKLTLSRNALAFAGPFPMLRWRQQRRAPERTLPYLHHALAYRVR
jgi:hypothetical protein